MFNFLKSKRALLVGSIILAVIAIGVLTRRNASDGGNGEIATRLPRVNILKVDDYQSTSGNLSANGTVESLEQVELRSQFGGPVARITTALGRRVGRGQILVSLQNSDLYAQAAQAAAGLKAQEARLAEMRKGLRSEELDVLETAVRSARDGYENTKRQQDVLVENAFRSLLSTGLAAFPNPGNTGGVSVTITGAYVSAEEGEYRISVYQSGVGLRYQYSGLEFGDGLVSTNPQPLGTRGLFLQFSNTVIPSQDGWRVPIPNTQSAYYVANYSLYQTALATRDFAVDGARNALQAAEAQLALRRAGATNEQLLAQEAAVESARAAVQLVNAQIEKTIIRSPISGVVASLPVRYGELISPGQLVASIINTSGVKIKAFFSILDLPGLKVGSPVVIDNAISGSILAVAPSLDPVSKSVEVSVSVDSGAKVNLVSGQNVSVAVPGKAEGNAQVYVIPVQAVRINELGTSVFVVNTDSVIEERFVKIGSTLGEMVEVVEGLEPAMKIVETVYELSPGQKVEVQE